MKFKLTCRSALICTLVLCSQVVSKTHPDEVKTGRKTLSDKQSLFGHIRHQWTGFDAARNSNSDSKSAPCSTRSPKNGSGLRQRPVNIPIKSIGDIIFPDIERSICGAWDSCVLRCGDPILGAPYLCSCDLNCEIFDDCCVDHHYYCGNDTTVGAVFPFADAKTTEELLSTLAQSSESEFLPVFIGSQNEPEPETFIIENLIKRDFNGEPTIVNKTLLDCRKVNDSLDYGVWFYNDTNVNRKCLLQVPRWCDPEYESGQHLSWDFTQSLSILLNFGPAGWNNDLLFSQDYYNPNRCPSHWEIWDPFTQICRPIECNPDFVLEDGQCVWDGDSPAPPDSYSLLGFKTKLANVTFSANLLMPDSWAQIALPILSFDIAESFSTKIRINSTRITETTVLKDMNPVIRTTTTAAPKTTVVVTTKVPTQHNATTKAVEKLTSPSPNGETTEGIEANVTQPSFEDVHLWVLSEEGFPITVNMSLEMKEKNSTNELTIEQVLSVLHEAVSIRAVLRTNKGVPMKINAVEKTLKKEEIDFFTKWCRGGDLNSYWNEDFEVLFVLKNKTEADGGSGGTKLEMAIHIKESDTTYDEGQYVANLLYQSSDINAEAANVSGVVMVCENRPHILNQTCPRISLNFTEFSNATDDGSLIYEGDIPGVPSPLNRSEYEFTPEGDVKLCIDYKVAKTSVGLGEPTLIEKIASWITMLLVALSLLGLLFTLVTYALFVELRTLPGWCLIHLCIAEFAFFLIFLSGARRPTSDSDFTCTAVAVSLHLTALLFFTWSTVISYDLYVTFTKFQPVTRSREKYLWRYTMVGYGIPLFIIFSCLMVEFHADHIISYGHHAICWIGNSMASLYVFALPISVCILASAVFFVLAVRGIRNVSKNSTASNLRANSSKDRARFFLYVRMSSVQCFAWIFGFLTVITHFDGTLSTIFEFIFLTLSSLQGLYIFFAFVWNERVKNLYKSRAFCKKRAELNRERSTVISRGRSVVVDNTSPSLKKPKPKTKLNRKSNNNNSENGANVTNVDPVNEGNKNATKMNVEKSNLKRKLSGNGNVPAERTVSNETIISVISN